MQYTLRNIPGELDALLRRKAQEERKSLNQVAIESLQRAFGLNGIPARQRDLSDIAGTWQEDPETEAALAEQRRVDVELWR